MMQPGLPELIAADKRTELQLLYGMCVRVALVPRLKTALAEHIKVTTRTPAFTKFMMSAAMG